MLKYPEKIKILFEPHDDLKIEMIDRIPHFAALDGNEKKLLSSVIHVRQFSSEEIIYTEASPSVAMYFIESGSVGLFKRFENTILERVQYIGPGKWVGYSAMLGEQPRRSTAKALENCSLVALLGTDLDHLRQNHPKAANKILLAVFNDVFDDLTDVQKEFLSLTIKLTKSNILI
ncbi:MAG: cyclic nucleotide-binding domain-containing protein [Calditrichaeota bacterium]|nr:cyclic nucleotide-binding domain-containing protein [Calditrichota bacterium]